MRAFLWAADLTRELVIETTLTAKRAARALDRRMESWELPIPVKTPFAGKAISEGRFRFRLACVRNQRGRVVIDATVEPALHGASVRVRMEPSAVDAAAFKFRMLVPLAFAVAAIAGAVVTREAIASVLAVVGIAVAAGVRADYRAKFRLEAQQAEAALRSALPPSLPSLVGSYR